MDNAKEVGNNDTDLTKGSGRDGTITALGSLIGSDEVARSEQDQHSNASSVTSSWMEVINCW